MGAVYEASRRHRAAGRAEGARHSIDSPEMRKRFLREGGSPRRSIIRTSVYIYGTEEIEEAPVIAMELVPGARSKTNSNAGSLPPREAVDAILQIVAGLEAAHAGGVLHRDVKPRTVSFAPTAR